MTKYQVQTPDHDLGYVKPIYGDSSAKDSDQPAPPLPLLRLHTLCIYEDDKHKLECTESEENKKSIPRIISQGLRQFSIIVCKKIEAKRRTTYTEVSDEIISEVSLDNKNGSFTQHDEKNIRRRVYDAFNVLLAIGLITRDKKDVLWAGFPHVRRELEEIVEERMKLLMRIQEKVNYLQELEEQFVGMKNLILRNKQLHKPENIPEGLALPLILVQTCPKATVEIEISEDTSAF